MLRHDKIQASIFGLVGWNQPTTSGYDIVDADNLGSTSGLKFQDASALVTIKNVKDCQEDRAVADVAFNTYLSKMQKAVISDVCSKVTQGESDHISSCNLYPFEKNFSDTLDTSNRFIGFKIVPICRNSILSVISQIELAFDLEKTFNVYLYNSNKKAAIATKSVTTSAGESVIESLEWYIADDVSYKGGTFYVGYFEDDLNGAKPYKRNYDMSSYQFQLMDFYIEPVYVQHTNKVLDVTEYQSLSDTGGLNIIINVYQDYTELMIRNKNKLAYAIQLSMAAKVLDLVKNSTRSNRTESITDENIKKINLELHGYKDETVYVQGVLSKIGRAIRDLKKDFFYKPRIINATLR